MLNQNMLTEIQTSQNESRNTISKPLSSLFRNQTMLSEMDELSGLIEHAKLFYRRPDLTPEIRSMIGYIASMAKTYGSYGTITSLARQFRVSRTFVYMLAETVEKTSQIIFGVNDSEPDSAEKKLAFSYMLSVRIEGQCSIGATSTILNRIGVKPKSDGSISEYLYKFGALTPNTLSTNSDEIQYCIFASDEIFAKSVPILITVDPVSSAIFKIELVDSRDAEGWKKHWLCLKDNGIQAVYLVCDDGTALEKAQKDSWYIKFKNSDTYHAIAHRMGSWVPRLLKTAESAIEYEADRIKKFDSAKTLPTIEKRFRQWENAAKIADEKIDVYEKFSYLYNCLIAELKVFDCNGKLRTRNEAEKNVKAGLDLIDELDHKKITMAANKVRRTLPNLFNYFDVAKEIVEEFEELNMDQEAFQALCLAHQWRKDAIKAKKGNRRGRAFENEQFCLEFAMGHLQEKYDDVKERVYEKLDCIVQSSAIVECINSIVRAHLNTSKNHVNQETLNLIMFYHNHRRYKAGKRKGKTPMEILTGEKQNKDWIEILFDLVEEKDPSFFA